jgi:predicted RNA-binding Zn-ribbon protein involved in translation (DUF1610 family)
MSRKSDGFTCPVCGWPDLDEPAVDEYGSDSFDICPSCGTQFGYQDARRSHGELRAEWIARGMPWHSGADLEPDDWDPVFQLREAGLEPT